MTTLTSKIKLGSDGKWRYGRKQVIQVALGIWAYKTTGRLLVELK